MIVGGSSKSKEKVNKPEVPELEAGTYTAYLFGVVNRGNQIRWDEDPIAPRVTLIFEVVGETVNVPDKETNELVDKPRIQFFDTKLSSHVGSKLVKFAKAAANVNPEIILKAEEIFCEFDLEKCIGVPVSIGVKHNKKGKAEIESFSQVSAKQAKTLPGLISEPFIFNPYRKKFLTVGTEDVFYKGMLKAVAQAVDHEKFSAETKKFMEENKITKFGTTKKPGEKPAKEDKKEEVKPVSTKPSFKKEEETTPKAAVKPSKPKPQVVEEQEYEDDDCPF